MEGPQERASLSSRRIEGALRRRRVADAGRGTQVVVARSLPGRWGGRKIKGSCWAKKSRALYCWPLALLLPDSDAFHSVAWAVLHSAASITRSAAAAVVIRPARRRLSMASCGNVCCCCRRESPPSERAAEHNRLLSRANKERAVFYSGEKRRRGKDVRAVQPPLPLMPPPSRSSASSALCARLA